MVRVRRAVAWVFALLSANSVAEPFPQSAFLTHYGQPTSSSAELRCGNGKSGRLECQLEEIQISKVAADTCKVSTRRYPLKMEATATKQWTQTDRGGVCNNIAWVYTLEQVSDHWQLSRRVLQLRDPRDAAERACLKANAESERLWIDAGAASGPTRIKLDCQYVSFAVL